MAASLPDPSLWTPALAGRHRLLHSPAGRLSLYDTGPEAADPDRPPLLLVHSVNAVASAAEVAPLYEHYGRQRRVFALELPGFGDSERSDRLYTPRLMTDALHAAVAVIRAEHGGVPVDLLAVSLSAEFAARTWVESRHSLRRLALVSPTGLRGRRAARAPAGGTRVIPWLYRVLTWPVWSQGLFAQLTRPAVIRYFLRRTQGSPQIDERLWREGVRMARQPGARHAPLHFVAGRLFSADVNAVYEAVTGPVWVSMATRGDFTDYRLRDTLTGRMNWRFETVEGGALPYFEDLPAFTARLDPFWL
ncbi:MAG: alpha/beta hydrolase [Rhodoferax sp.]|nr:alpha/beta hydrolase [Rhodoferax sp.]